MRTITTMKLAAVLCLTAIPAHAAEYRQVFLSNGRELTPEQAIVASMKGAEVLKCQSAEFKVSKSGTSIGIRNVKKPHKN